MSTIDAIHPGEHLAEILSELEISQYRLVKTMPEYWLNLQKMYDLDVARATGNLADIEPLAAVG